MADRPLSADSPSLAHDLRETVVALRAELERAKADAEQAIGQARSAAASELAQVQGTILALRGELERLRAAAEDDAARVAARHRVEVTELQAMVVALRQRIEAPDRAGRA